MRIGVYPGTFDPITNGHVDLINRGLRLFDKIYVAVAANPQKHPVLALDERVELVRLATKDSPSRSRAIPRSPGGFRPPAGSPRGDPGAPCRVGLRV